MSTTEHPPLNEAADKRRHQAPSEPFTLVQLLPQEVVTGTRVANGFQADDVT
jgi:hypothetical protein